MKLTTLLAAAALALSGTAALAAPLDAIDNGWYNASGFHNTGNRNIATGSDTTTEYRSFFVFDISGLTGPVTSATFSVAASTNNCGSSSLGSTGCLYSDDGSEEVALFDVSTSTGSLTGGTAGVAGFNDLGTGNSYGSMTITGGNITQMPLVSIILNSFGLADLNAAIGANSSTFSIGAALQTIVGGDNELIWWFSDNATSHGSLDVNVGGQIPLPASLPLLLAGLGVLGIARRRRTV